MNLIKRVPRQSNEDWEPVSWTMDSYYACEDQTIMIRRGDFDPREITANEVPCESAYATSWASYAQHVMKSGEDPLDAFQVATVDAVPVTWILKLSEVCGSLYLISGRRSRGPSIPASDLPPYVLDYLGAIFSNARRLSPRSKRTMLRIKPAPDDIPASILGVARMLIPKPRALTLVQIKERRREAAEAFLISQRSKP